MYADQNPGVLNLDIDRLRELIGGWQERFAETGALVRPLALSMATTHLAAGHDVVMPQYLGDVKEVERFESAALSAGANFDSLALMDDKERSVDRFYRRDRAAAAGWDQYVLRIVEESGGRGLLGQMHDRLLDVIQQRPGTIVVPSVENAPAATFESFVTALARIPSQGTA